MSDSEQCSNGLQLDLISILVNLSYEFGEISGYFEEKSKVGLKM